MPGERRVYKIIHGIYEGVRHNVERLFFDLNISRRPVFPYGIVNLACYRRYPCFLYRFKHIKQNHTTATARFTVYLR